MAWQWFNILLLADEVSHIEMLAARVGVGEAATCFFEGGANKEDAF